MIGDEDERAVRSDPSLDQCPSDSALCAGCNGAGEREVFLLVASSVLNRDDVLGLVFDKRFIVLPGVAIFAPVLGTFTDAPARGLPIMACWAS